MNKLNRIKKWLYGPSFTQLMEREGTNKYRIAKNADISYQSLLNWEAGRCRPNDRSALAVAAYLGLISEKDQIVELEKQAAEFMTRVDKMKERL